MRYQLHAFIYRWIACRDTSGGNDHRHELTGRGGGGGDEDGRNAEFVTTVSIEMMNFQSVSETLGALFLGARAHRMRSRVLAARLQGRKERPD